MTSNVRGMIWCEVTLKYTFYSFSGIWFSLSLKMNAEKYFKTRNLYEILEVSSDAEIQEGKNLF